jgi:VCBS repeat-containing protein
MEDDMTLKIQRYHNDGTLSTADADNFVIDTSTSPQTITIYLPENRGDTDEGVNDADEEVNLVKFVHSDPNVEVTVSIFGTSFGDFFVGEDETTYESNILAYDGDAQNYESSSRAPLSLDLYVELYNGEDDTEVGIDFQVVIEVSDVDEKPTGIDVTYSVPEAGATGDDDQYVRETDGTYTIKEGTYANGLKLADITIQDDALGVNELNSSLLESMFVYKTNGNTNTAELWLKAGTTLDFEGQSDETITAIVGVTGSGEGKNLTASNLVFTIKDADEKPTGVEVRYSAPEAGVAGADDQYVHETNGSYTIKEGTYANGLKLADITIQDDAIGDNRFTDFPPESKFIYKNINGNTAELWLKDGATLDFEGQNDETITAIVGVTGSGEGRNPTASNLVFTIKDVGEPPIFVDNSPEQNPVDGYSFDVNNVVGTAIGTVKISDPDAGDTFRYSLRSKPGDYYISKSKFRINAETGEITLRSAVTGLEFDEPETFEITVRATSRGELGNYRIESIITITLYPEDIVFDEDHIEIGTAENPGITQMDTNVGDVVGRANAVASHGKTITYSLSGDDAGFYAINADGEITLSKPYGNIEATSTTHSITITAHAEGEDSVAAPSTTISVNKTDVDNFTAEVIDAFEGQNFVFQPVNQVDDDGDTLRFAPTDAPVLTTNGSYVVLESGHLVWTMTQGNFVGTETFSVTVLDSRGGSTTTNVEIDTRAAPDDDNVIIDGNINAYEDDPRNPGGQITLHPAKGTNFSFYVDGISIRGDTKIVLDYGTLTVDEDGTWSYELQENNPVVNGLDGDNDDGDGAVGTLTDSVKISYLGFSPDSSQFEGISSLLKITIHGSTDFEGVDGTADYSHLTEDLALSLSDHDAQYGIVKGGSGDDKLRGSTTSDIILGNEGNDVLIGDDVDDVLIGGDDVLIGGSGADILTGGAGADQFILYQGTLQTGQNYRDVVTDFTRGTDKIKVDSFGGTDDTLVQLLVSAKLRIEYEDKTTTDTNDANVKDAVIYYTNGNDDATDDVILMVVEDTVGLTRDDFTEQPPKVIDLSTLNGKNGFRLDGESVEDHSGWSVSAAGDINKDGYDDFIIGAPSADPRGGWSGSSYVVFGKASGFDASIDLSSLNGRDGFRLDGKSSADLSGRSVSGAGDVNNDGHDDIIIGAAWADHNGSRSGSSYVVFGKASGFTASINLSSLNGRDGFRLDGVKAEDWSGRSVSGAGDINGDDYDDIIIGAPRADPNGLSSGSSYVVFGKAANEFTASIDLSSLNGRDGFRLDGEGAGDVSGYSVSGADDVNGDGYDDIIIGAWVADHNGYRSGSSYVVFGKASGFTASIALSSLNGRNGFRLDGENAREYSGHSVSGAGDVNGDDYDDIIIGAYRADGFRGSSYVVFGKASGFTASIDLSSLDGTNGFRLDGENADDNSGWLVSGAGDFNGDGFDDIIIGATGADHNSSNSGSSYVVFGKADGFDASIDLSSLSGGAGFRLDGENADDLSGWSVSVAGDVNNDGYDDLIIGAISANPNGQSSGSSYVVFGYATGLAIEGDAYVGETLTATGLPNSALFIWKRYLDDTNVETIGTGHQYTLTADDIGKTLKAEASYTNLNGDLISLTSETTAPVGRIFGDSDTLETVTGTVGNDLIEGGGGIDKLIGSQGDDIFVLYQGEGADNHDEVRDFRSGRVSEDNPGSGNDRIRIDLSNADVLSIQNQIKAGNTATALETLKTTAEISIVKEHYNYGSGTRDVSNDATIKDTVIYDTRGTVDTTDNVVLMVLQDFNTSLTIDHFDIV